VICDRSRRGVLEGPSDVAGRWPSQRESEWHIGGTSTAVRPGPHGSAFSSEARSTDPATVSGQRCAEFASRGLWVRFPSAPHSLTWSEAISRASCSSRCRAPCARRCCPLGLCDSRPGATTSFRPFGFVVSILYCPGSSSGRGSPPSNQSLADQLLACSAGALVLAALLPLLGLACRSAAGSQGNGNPEFLESPANRPSNSTALALQPDDLRPRVLPGRPSSVRIGHQ
jgi:hypothetical protein